MAADIAASVGAPVEPEPFTPELRGLLLTEYWGRYLKPEEHGSTVASGDMKWPPTKIAGRELARYLRRLQPSRV